MVITGSCHCGDTAFKIEGELPTKLTRCTCSFCAKRGTLYAYFEPAQFSVTKQAQQDQVYRWHTKLVAHHFCGRCGCTTYSDSPDFKPNGDWDGETRRLGVNARLIDGIVAADMPFDEIDGKHLW